MGERVTPTRLLVAGAAVVLLAAVFVVPLPLVVSQPGTLLPVADVAKVTVAKDFAARSGEAQPPKAQGSYVAPAQRQRPSPAVALLAALSPSASVGPRPRVSTVEHEQPDIAAALIGLGLSPVRMQGAPLPVAVDVAPSVSPAALGVALHLFDATSVQDAARGRTILGLGSVDADLTLSCEPGVAESIAAAEQDDVDLIVIAAACEAPAEPAVKTLRVNNFNEAINALLDAG